MYVRTSEISPVIKQFINRHNAEHPIRHGGSNKPDATIHIPTLQGRAFICQRTGYGDQRIQNIINCKSETIKFEIADKIMCAIDRPDVFVNGEVEIID